MSSLASYAALAAKFDNTLRAQNRAYQLRRPQAGVGEGSSNLSMQKCLTTATIGEQRFPEHLTGREHGVFRPTDLWYSTMKAGGIRHARSRSPKKALFGAPTQQAKQADLGLYFQSVFGT
jgi:hypothetical protein